jgi:hypothetical protein
MTSAMESGIQGQQLHEPTGLSQVERVADVFVAPTKTFLDIRRDASWWLPFLLGILVSVLFVTAVDRGIGFDQVALANVNRSARAQERLSTMTDAQREQVMYKITDSTRIVSYAYPLGTLIFALIVAGILMMSFNFGLSARASYKEYVAVWFYAGMPLLLKFLLAAGVIFAGATPEGFNIRNPIGTNIGWYLPSDTSQWARTLFSSVDVFTIWAAILVIVGCATIARVKRSRAAFIVIGWWVFTIFASTVTAAFQRGS